MIPDRLNLIFPLPLGWIARDLSILLVCSRSRHRVGTQYILPHESFWDCHICKGLYDSQYHQNQIANTTSSIHKLPLNCLFMSRGPWLVFSSNPSYENCHYILKTTAFSLKKTEWKKKIKGWLVTLPDIYCQPTKVICWIAWRHQESCCKDITVSFTIVNLEH